MATTNNVKCWIGVLITEDSSIHWRTKRRHLYSETSRRVGLEFVCVFGHDGHPFEHMPPEDNDFYTRVGAVWSALSDGGVMNNNYYAQEVKAGRYGETMHDLREHTTERT